VEGDHTWLLDLDGLCLADPSVDVAAFMAYLDLNAVPDRERFRAAYLDEYAALRREVPARWPFYEALLLLSRVARPESKRTASSFPIAQALSVASERLRQLAKAG
jgi:hypothetical protein